jgi:hypothetical protein
MGVPSFQRTIIEKRMAMQWTVSYMYSIKLDLFTNINHVEGRGSKSQRLLCICKIS